MKRLRFHSKVGLAFLTVLLVCFLLLNLISGLLLRPMFIADSRRQMASYCIQIDQALSRQARGEEIEELLLSFRDAYQVNTTVLGKDETVQYSSQIINRRKPETLPGWMRELLAEFQAQTDNPYEQERYNQEDQLKRLKYIRRTEDGGYIILSKSIRGIEQNVRLVSLFLLMACLIVALVGVPIWMLCTRSFSYSLERMSQVTRSLAQLDFRERVAYHGSVEEVRVLSSSIDQIADRLEQSLSELQRDLEHQKELLRNLSHEIKTPLTTIKGYTENMQIVTMGDERVERYCGIIVEECEALDWLATEMMDVSTLEGSDAYYEKQVFTAMELFQRVEQRVQREMAGQGIVINWKPGTLYGNLHLLERAVTNYLMNAVKYRTHGTEVRLEGRPVGDCYELSVLNRGDPIPEEERDKIWEAFYKGDKSRRRSGSHGIGLSIVKQIANIHRAQVGVQCGKDWNRFWFTTPSEPLE